MTTRYHGISQFFHWLTAILVLVTFTLGPGGSEQHVYAASRDLSRQWHETLGLLVVGLTVLRLVWRVIEGREPSHLGSSPADLAARVVQRLLYAALFVVPASAVLGAWLQGHPLTLLAGVQVAPLMGVQRTLGDWISFLHPWLGDAFMWLAGLHAAAALMHHWIMRDDVLMAMLPRAAERVLGRR